MFSNFYEELIFRGFLLATLGAAFGFWPAALLSSVAFGMVHISYPAEGRALVGLLGFVFCIVQRPAQSLWAPWLAHMSTDVAIDAFVQ